MPGTPPRLYARVDPYIEGPPLFDLEFSDGTTATDLTFGWAMHVIVERLEWSAADARVFLQLACESGEASTNGVAATFGGPPKTDPDTVTLARNDAVVLWSWAAEALSNFPPEKLPPEPHLTQARATILAVGEMLAEVDRRKRQARP